MSKAIRQDIIKYVTDRPHQVINKTEIMEAGGWTAQQVTHAILRLQRSTSIGDEVETLVRGNSWRYVPRHPVRPIQQVARASDTSLPVTTLIRQFFVAHPHTNVTVDQLVAYTGRRLDQVKVGVNNLRNIAANADVTAHISVVVNGQMWRFDPPDDWRPGRGVRPTTMGRRSSVETIRSHETAHNTPQVPVEPAASSPSINGHAVRPTDADEGRMFEELGLLRDGRIVIRDQNGEMYTATPMKQ